MSLSTSFELLSFQRKVEDALQFVERALELERKPQLAADVDHDYGAKYGLVNSVTNTAIIAYINCFEKLGLDMDILTSIDKTKPVTLRFEASASHKFLKEKEVEVPLAECTWSETEKTNEGDSTSTKTKAKSGAKSVSKQSNVHLNHMQYLSLHCTKNVVLSILRPMITRTHRQHTKIVNRITEFHWESTIDWKISIYSGTAVENKKVIMSRVCKTGLITQSKRHDLENTVAPPIELSLSWLMKQISQHTSDKQIKSLNSQFNIDTDDVKTKTPRRNDAVQEAEEFATRLRQWCEFLRTTFLRGTLRTIMQRNNPAKPTPSTTSVGQLMDVKSQYALFNPILPLMEEHEPHEHGVDSINNNTAVQNGLLSAQDTSKLLDEHAQTLARAYDSVKTTWPGASKPLILTSSEATLSLLCDHLIDLSIQYRDTMDYIESMLESQLIAAIGKRLTSKDVDTFVKYHNARLLSPSPRPFSHAIRRPEHYPGKYRFYNRSASLRPSIRLTVVW